MEKGRGMEFRGYLGEGMSEKESKGLEMEREWQEGEGTG